MAPNATVYRCPTQLANVDAGVYDSFDLRLARHPSETERYLLARLVAFCLVADPALEFSKLGLSSPDEPALHVRTLDGRLACGVEIGNPTAEKLHKACKASPRVVVVTHHDPDRLVADVAAARVHKAESVEVFAIDPAFLDALARHIGDRGCPVDVTVSDGDLYVTAGGEALSTTPRRVPLGA